MKLVEIQDLIKFVAKAGVNEVEIHQKDFKITIKSDSLAKKKNNQFPETVVQQIPVNVPAAAPVAQVVQQQPVAAAPAVPAVDQKKAAEDKYVIIKSPMIGTFYRSSSPDVDPFIGVGDKLKKGDTICIVEAMKLFNEIDAELSGTVVKILADDASPVEFDQPLFLIDPS